MFFQLNSNIEPVVTGLRMIDSHDKLFKDMEAVRQIPIVTTMLDVICQTTGMGFAAIARVTEDRWLACCVRDEVQFGLQEGGELKIETTLCNEIRDHHQPVIIDHVEKHPQYRSHHTPRIYLWAAKLYILSYHLKKRDILWNALCHRFQTCGAQQHESHRYVYHVCRTIVFPSAKRRLAGAHPSRNPPVAS